MTALPATQHVWTVMLNIVCSAGGQLVQTCEAMLAGAPCSACEATHSFAA